MLSVCIIILKLYLQELTGLFLKSLIEILCQVNVCISARFNCWNGGKLKEMEENNLPLALNFGIKLTALYSDVVFAFNCCLKRFAIVCNTDSLEKNVIFHPDS